METKCLEALFKELNESKNVSRQAELQQDIRVIQSKFVREMDNEGLIHLLRFLKPKEKTGYLLICSGKDLIHRYLS
jgi:hypothetical protein